MPDDIRSYNLSDIVMAAEENDLYRKMVSTMAAEYIILLNLYAQAMMHLMPNSTIELHHTELNERMNRMERAFMSTPEGQKQLHNMISMHVKKHIDIAFDLDTTPQSTIH